jgi:D-alanyl-D-alanine carboxypeptidase
VSDAPPPPAVTASFLAVVDGETGALLYGQGEHSQVAPASITKIATAMVALERGPALQQVVPVTISGSQMAARDGSSIMGLEPGHPVSMETLLYGLMLPSGNDAAEQIALVVGGSRQRFVELMNQKVADLGLQDTHFANPSGMDAAGHYSSAYDMALLARNGMRDERFRDLAGAATYSGDGYQLGNLNRLIGRYAGADGVKIGSTPRAGRTIVASATRNGHRIYVGLMRSSDLPGDSAALLDWAWATFRW